MGRTHENLLRRKAKRRSTLGDEAESGGGTPDLSPVVALQQQVGNRAVQRQLTIQRQFIDVPTAREWKRESSVRFQERSKDLKVIDAALESYQRLQGSIDMKERRSKLMYLQVRINDWVQEKAKKYGNGQESDSARYDAVMDLKRVVDDKLQTLTGLHRGMLQPIVAAYHDAAQKKDLAKTHDQALMLQGQDNDLFVQESQQAMTAAKGSDIDVWKTYFFSAPAFNVGAGPFALFNLKSIGNFDWLDTTLADHIIEEYLPRTISGGSSQQALMLMQERDFRLKLKEKASASAYQQLLDTMPLVRIADETEDNLAGDFSDIDLLAQTVFEAFLNDLPISDLKYSAVSGDFKTIDFLLGNHDKKVGAPCMMLSSVFDLLFKSMVKNPPQVEQKGDDRPLLTKKLASIGNEGILTRDTSFDGNVAQYGEESGTSSINRVFFGDGHIWLEVNGKEYDPTLGISGDKGTVAGAVEKFYTRTKHGFTDGTMAVTRNETPPPGGAPLNFVRTVFIEDPKKPKKRKK